MDLEEPVLGTVCAPKCDMSTEARAALMALKDERGQPVKEHLPQVVIVDAVSRCALCLATGNIQQNRKEKDTRLHSIQKAALSGHYTLVQFASWIEQALLLAQSM